MSRCACGKSRKPPLLHVWRKGTAMPRAARLVSTSLKRANWRLAKVLSVSSDCAKCVITPSSRIAFSAQINSSRGSASSQRTPYRLMPEWIFTCTGTGFPKAVAIFASARTTCGSFTQTVRSCATHHESSASWRSPSNSSGAVMPSSRRVIASSRVLKPQPHAPSSRVMRATSSAPCPYASSFTTASSFTAPGKSRRINCKLRRSLPRSISVHAGRNGKFSEFTFI